MRTLFILLICCLLANCADPLVKKPDNLIPQGRMSEILYDIAVLDAIDNNYPKALEQNDIRIMEEIYAKYGIDSAQLADSDLYYASVPALYEQIYQAIEDRMNRERDSVARVIQEGNAPAATSDSLNRRESAGD